MKTVKIFLISILTFFVLIIGLFLGYSIMSQMKETEEGKKEFISLIKEAKTKYNFTMNKNDYEIEVIGHKGGYVFKSPPPVYGIKKKGISYKSEYFKELEDMYYEITGYGTLIGFDDGRWLLKIVADFGLQPYILNTLIYDKTKGNNFEKIEQIFKKHEGKITYHIESNIWECGGIESQFEQSYNLNYVNNINCREKYEGSTYYNAYNSEVMEEYGKRYEKYFSTPRSLETINWEEYMKIHEIYPIIEFYFDGTKEEKEKLRKEIEPYYNKKILDIIIS
ncbi:hypothetical protein GCWU000323_02078 [Leptotrichia hofstadii F0254]|uniref:Uncharacterized protein n=2 Tax=Leptotrichia hofstadii TaxID=157688 RepID=C9MZV8_9FUSO|nr:hypothetical protein GCWU000323_02078 [Leptotrichia hofstadii F0254]